MSEKPVILITEPEKQLIEKDNLEIEINNYDNSHLYYKGFDLGTFKEIANLRQENKQLKDNQVRAMNKIRDFINDANCEIKESKYSNDKHGLYWELFKKDLTNIQKLIKGINTDEYVNIPKYREKELLNLENNLNKLKEIIKKKFVAQGGFTSYEWNDLLNKLLDKIQEIERGVSDVED